MKKQCILKVKELSRKNIILFVLACWSLCSCETNKPVDYTSIEGFYSCNEGSVHSGYKKYIVEIDQVKSQDNVYIIANFHKQGDNEFLYAEYSQDTLYIKNQVISNLFVTGKGKVYDDFKRIELLYTTDDGVVQLDYSALLER